jgi:ferredoxin
MITLKTCQFPLPYTDYAACKKYGLIPEYGIISNNKPVINDFQVPRSMDTDWNIPRFVKIFLRNVFLKKPGVQKNMCKSCGICVKTCPAKAMSLNDKGPVFDYSRCIRSIVVRKVS